MKILHIVNEKGDFYDKLDGAYSAVDYPLIFDEDGNLSYVLGFSDTPDGYAVAKVFAYDNMGAIIRFDTENPEWEIVEDHRNIPKYFAYVYVFKGIISNVKLFSNLKEAEDFVKLEHPDEVSDDDSMEIVDVIPENIPYYNKEENENES